MTNRFRPNLDALEAREVPAAFSFVLPNGTIGSGLFSTPATPDYQVTEVPLSDLTVTVGGVAYAVQPGAVANYVETELVGVTAAATGPGGTLVLDEAGAALDESAAVPVTLDAADTEITFTLPDGTTGAISYTVPWDQVDATQASQSIAPTGFNLNIAGQNFSYGSASFTTAPTLTFEYGDFTGLNFALDTSTTAGFAYTSVAMSGLDVTAVVAGTNQQLLASANIKNTVVRLDFSEVTTGKA